MVVVGNSNAGDGVRIAYGGILVFASLSDVRDAETALLGYNDVVRKRILLSVKRLLKARLPRVMDGSASLNDSSEFADQVVTWFAGRVIDGRASIDA
jgi:hypothetical protein